MFKDFNPIPVSAEVASHINHVFISCDGWDDVAVLVCQREACLVDYRDSPTSPIRKVRWTSMVDGMSIEEVLKVRNEHLRKYHPRARIPTVYDR